MPGRPLTLVLFSLLSGAACLLLHAGVLVEQENRLFFLKKLLSILEGEVPELKREEGRVAS